jgi:alpha-tubulin suppressor-like RCC1 family protein
VAWGSADSGGDALDLSNIVSISCGRDACVALKSDARAVAWGDAAYGGDATGVDLTNVATVICGGFACAALKNDGTVEV